MTALALSILTFFSTALGGLFALRKRNRLYLVMGFSAGVLIAAALVDLLPEALEMIGPNDAAAREQIFLFAMLGFFVYFTLDFFVHLGAAGHEERVEATGHADHVEHVDSGGHKHHHHNHVSFGSAAALGLTVHSFLDGFAIGGGFQASARIGWLVAIAVLAHDFGDGVTTIGIVLGSKGKLRTSIGWLLADAIAPVLGCAAALAMTISTSVIAYLLGFFAGSFLFIGAAHLLPEAEHEGKVRWLYFVVVAGFGLMGAVNYLASLLH
jgi:zinc transporter ZupT